MQKARYPECITLVSAFFFRGAIFAATLLTLFLFGAHAASAATVEVPKAIEGEVRPGNTFVANAGGVLGATDIMVSTVAPGPFAVTGGTVDAILTYGGVTLSGTMKIRFPTGGGPFEATVLKQRPLHSY